MVSGWKPDDSSQHVWVSLLGLLNPIEYFVTVDHFSVWRRHLAWAKNDGGELRKCLTERFASSMVLLSLFLGAELSVLFNGSQSATLMRMHMRRQDYSEISFWIGDVIFLSVFLTLSAILSTFTAWGMVSSISDCNMHCLLRSSIGQYVTQLPSRLLVTALISFFLWVVLYLFVMLPGILGKILFVATTCLFFHIVIVYSAFGRLILHTGAMGEKRIFDSDFEKKLLPSGLHISLLIKATEQQRKNTHASAQYRKSVLEGITISEESGQMCSLDKITAVNGNEMEPCKPASLENPTTQNVQAVAHHATSNGCSSLSREMHLPPLPTQLSKESLMETSQLESENKSVRKFPRASVLNKVNMTLKAMRQVVDTTLSRQPTLKQNKESPTRGVLGTWKERRRRSQRRSGAMSFIKEWESDNETRSMYNVTPPADLDDAENTEDGNDRDEWKRDDRSNLPRPSVLNRASHTFKLLTPLPEPEGTPRVRFAKSIEEGERSLNQELHDPTSKTSTFFNLAPSSIATITMQRPTEKRSNSFSGSLSPLEDVCNEENPGTGAKTNLAAKRYPSCDQQELHCTHNGEQEHLLAGVGLQHTNYSSGLEVLINSHAIDEDIIDEVGSETGKENSHGSMPT